MLRKMFPSKQTENGEDNSPKGGNFCGAERRETSDINRFFCSSNAAELGSPMSESEICRQLQNYKDYGNLHDLHLDFVSPPFQSYDDEIRKIHGVESQNSHLTEAKKEGSHVFLEVLRRHEIRHLKLDEKKSRTGSQIQSIDISTDSMMSTPKIIELAAENFIQSTSQSEEISTISHPYPSSVLGHFADVANEVQLVQNLLLCADKVGKKKYKIASNLLEVCHKMSSSTGTPIERLVFYFTEALYEKIDRETGTITPKGLGKISDPLEAMKSTNTFQILFHKNHPLSQIIKFSGIQAVIDHVAEASKVHVIDLEIRTGIHCAILMQALVARSKNPIQHLKITAVGTESQPMIDETGRQLMAFAESLNLKFSFHAVVVSDILDLNENLFVLDSDEAVAIFSAYALTTMIGRAGWLEHLMSVIKNISPCVMIVTEMEANCNSPTFGRRFVEALFFFGVFFDSVAECMKNEEKTRREAESTCFSSCIRNIVAAEGVERKVRHVSIDVWREFFTHFGLVETELSMSSVYQANLVRQSFAYGSSFTLGMDGKCLTIGWKGTPISTLSAWKFQINVVDET